MTEVVVLKLGKMLDQVKNKGELRPYLRNINVRWGHFDLGDLAEMRVTAEEAEELSVCDGDIFVCEGGEPGRAAVWQGGSSDLVFQKALHRLRPYPDVDARFIAAYLSFSARHGLLTEFLTGTTIKHLPQDSLSRIVLPLPPVAEQRRIVAKLDTLTTRITRARSELQKVAALTGSEKQIRLLDRLEASILAKAFRGELVPQDPADEPASMLLDRIRANRACAPKVRRGRRTSLAVSS